MQTFPLSFYIVFFYYKYLFLNNFLLFVIFVLLFCLLFMLCCTHPSFHRNRDIFCTSNNHHNIIPPAHVAILYFCCCCYVYLFIIADPIHNSHLKRMPMHWTMYYNAQLKQTAHWVRRTTLRLPANVEIRVSNKQALKLGVLDHICIKSWWWNL